MNIKKLALIFLIMCTTVYMCPDAFAKTDKQTVKTDGIVYEPQGESGKKAHIFGRKKAKKVKVKKTQTTDNVKTKDDFDKNEWTVYGEPNTTIVVERPATVELTCASIVNRIPDVINAKAGYVPTADMGELRFKIKSLNEYVKGKF